MMDFCHDWHFRPFRGCVYGMLCSVLACLLILMHFILFVRIKLSPPVQYHSGYLPFLFVTSCFFHILLILNPVLFIFIDRVLLTAQISLFLASHTAFWFILLIIRIASRNFHEHPVPLVLSEAFAVLAAIVPLFFWTPWIVGRLDFCGKFHITKKPRHSFRWHYANLVTSKRNSGQVTVPAINSKISV